MKASLLASTAAGFYAALQAGNGLFVESVGSAAWCGAFALLYCNRRRPAAILALTLALPPRAIYAAAGFFNGVWTSAAIPTLLTLLWALFWIILLRNSESKWIGRLTTPLILLTALASVGDLLTVLMTVNSLVSGGLALSFRNNLTAAVWRNIVSPLVIVFYWISQVRYLQAVRSNEG